MLHEDHALGLDISDLVLRNHVCFTKDFDGEVVPCGFLPCEEDRAEGTFGNRFNDLEVFDGRRGIALCGGNSGYTRRKRGARIRIGDGSVHNWIDRRVSSV